MNFGFNVIYLIKKFGQLGELGKDFKQLGAKLYRIRMVHPLQFNNSIF